MAMTFGATTGDDTTFTLPNTLGADGHVGLIVGTWYPTTLTATRAYWGAGNNLIRAAVAGTTSELTLHSNNTTDGVWTTTGAGIVVNQWHFIAMMFAFENTAVAGDWRVWVGTESRFPEAVTVTNTTPRSGNYTGSTGFTVGNAGSGGTVAFQGDVGWVSVLNHSGHATVDTVLPVSASGVISDDDAAHIFHRWVVPFYYGRPSVTHAASSYTAGSGHQVFHVPLQQLASAVYSFDSTVGGSFIGTTNSGTVVYSANSPFTIPDPSWPLLHPSVRR